MAETIKPPYYREHLNKIAPIYDRAVKFITFFIGGETRFRRGVIDELEVKAGQTFLEICCGTGTLSLIAAQRGALVTGVDLAEKMLKVATEKVKKAGLRATFSQQNAEAIQLPDASFDRVLISFGLHELPLPAQKNTLKEIQRLLKPGGSGLIVDYGQAKGIVGLIHGFILRFTEEPSVRQFIQQDLVQMLKDAGLKNVTLSCHYFGTMRYVKFER